MRVSSRLTLRTMMIAVAVVGLTFGLATELQNRQGRDASARAEATDRRRAAWHAEQAAVSAAAVEQQRPYSARERNSVHRRAARLHDVGLPGGSFPGWAAEVTYHRYWARWYADQAEAASRRRQNYQRRLLWPF